MDLHNMKRKELQKLCKKHNLPANMTNLDMVDKLSSLVKVQEKEKPMRKTRSCLKNSDEMSSENESDVLKRKSKKVRFSPQNDVFQLGDKESVRDLVVENKGGVSRVTRGRASLGKTVLTSPVALKRNGKRAVQEVEKGDLVVENESGGSRVTRARASLGKNVVISSPVVMKKRAKRALQKVEKEDLDVESKSGASRVTRAGALLGEKVLVPTPVVVKKRGKSAVQEDEKADSVVEYEGSASRVTRARAGKQGLILSPVVMKKRGKRAFQEEKNSGSASSLVVDITSSDAAEKNEMITVKFLRNRKVESVISPKNIVRKRSTKKRSQNINAEVSENKNAEAEGGITQPKMNLRRSTLSVISEESEGLMDETDRKVSRKNLRQGTRQRASTKSSVEDADKKTVAGEISQPEVVTRQSKRNWMEFTQVEPSEENLGAIEKAGRRKITRSRNQFQAKASTVSRESEIIDVIEEAKEVVVQVEEPIRRSGRHDNPDHANVANDSKFPKKSDESTRYQTRHGTKRMSVMPQMKKAKTEKPVGNSGKKNVVVKNSPNESTKSKVLEKGSETGHIRRSKRNASGNDSLVHSEDANGSGSDVKKGTTKKRRRDEVLEEVPLQHTGKSVSTEAGNILEELEEETPVASEPHTRSGSRQKSFMHSAKKLNMSGNLGPSRPTGEKTSPHHTREISMVPKSPATGTRQLKTVAVTPRTRSGREQSKTVAVTPRTRSGSEQSKTVAVTPRTRTGSGQKSLIHTNRKLQMSGKFGPNKTIGDKKSTHLSKELSMAPRRSETELKVRGSKSKQTPVVHGHSRRFTRSAIKGKTDGPTYVRGKIYQKESQSISKLPLSKVESSVPKAISASKGPLDIDVQSSYHEVDRIAVDLVSGARDLPQDGTARSTPEGSSAKTSNVDLNVQESEGPELINIREASSSGPLKLQSDHAEHKVNISDREHTPVERQTSYNVQSSIPKIAGSSDDPISDASNSCRGVDTCATVQDIFTATQANDKTPVHLEPAEGLDVAGDVASIDRNSVDDGFSSLEHITSKGLEVNPQTNGYVELSSGGIANVVLEGSTVPEEQSMNRFSFPEDGCSTIPVSNIGDVSEDNTTATQQVKSSETNVASPHLVNFKTDNASGEGYPVDTNALADISLVDQLTLTRTKERPQPSKDVELSTKGMDLNSVFQGPAVHEDEPVYQLPLAEVAEITDNPVTGNSNAACVTQQEGPTEIDARSPPMVHPKSVAKVDIIGDAGAIDAGSVDDNLLSVEQINSSAIKEKQEVSENVNHVVAEGSTVDEEKLTAEVGDCGPTEHEHDICSHSAEFLESDGLDKHSKSVFKEDGEASFADLTNRTVSVIFTVEKDDTMHPEISVQAQEPHNTISKSIVQEKEFPVPNSILTTEEASNLEYEFSKPEFSDTDMCNDEELAEGSNQRLSTVKSCSREESCTNKCIEFSTSMLVSDSVARGNNILEAKAPSSPLCVAEVGNLGEGNEELNPEKSPLHVAEVGNLVVEVNEELKPEDHPSSSPLSVAEVCNHVVEVNEELKPEDSHSTSPLRVAEVGNLVEVNEEMKPEDYPTSSPLSVAEVCNHVVEVNEELKPEDSPSSSPSRVAEVGNLVEVNEELKPEGSPSSSPLRVTEVADLVVEVNEELKPEGSPSSSPLRVTEVADLVVEVNEELKPEGSPSSSPLRVTEVADLVVEVNEELKTEGSPSSSPLRVTEVADLVVEVNEELKTEDLPSNWCSDILERAVEGSPSPKEQSTGEYSAVGILGREVEETVFEDTVKNASERTSSMYGDAHNILESQLPMEREGDLEETTCSISGDDEKNRMNKNTSIERTPVITEDDIDRAVISCPVIAQEFPSNVDDYCLTPSGDGCGKEQGTDMSMVKSSRNFGKEFSSQLDYCHRSFKDSCGKDQGTPMSMVKSSKNCGEGFSSQHDNIIEQVEVGSVPTLPQTICEDFAGFDNQMVAELIGSTGRQISSLVQMDVDTNNVESSRDNFIVVDTIHRFDQKADATRVPTEELPRNEDAMDSDAPANLQYGDGSVTFSGKTNKAQGLSAEELPRNEHAMDADAPAHVQYGCESLTITGETNQAQERGPEEISFFSDIFGSELKSRSDEMDEEESDLWFEDASYMLDKSEDAGKVLDFSGFPIEEQLQSSGEEHTREKGPESIGNQHAASKDPRTGGDNISVQNSVGTLNESYLESEANKDAHQKVDCCINNKFNEDFTRTES